MISFDPKCAQNFQKKNDREEKVSVKWFHEGVAS